jgi:hypothetical protein
MFLFWIPLYNRAPMSIDFLLSTSLRSDKKVLWWEEDSITGYIMYKQVKYTDKQAKTTSCYTDSELQYPVDATKGFISNHIFSKEHFFRVIHNFEGQINLSP